LGSGKSRGLTYCEGLHSYINYPVHERNRFLMAMLKPLPLSNATKQLRSDVSAIARRDLASRIHVRNALSKADKPEST